MDSGCPGHAHRTASVWRRDDSPQPRPAGWPQRFSGFAFGLVELGKRAHAPLAAGVIAERELRVDLFSDCLVTLVDVDRDRPALGGGGKLFRILHGCKNRKTFAVNPTSA